MRLSSIRGATTVEMTLVGIPIIFLLISIFEISRGMWMYNTASVAVREGVRFASVHGQNCVNNPPSVPNQCDVTANDVVKVIRAGLGSNLTHGLNYGPTGAGAAGLPEPTTILTFTSKTVTFNCPLDGTSGGEARCGQTWPPTTPIGENTVRNQISISMRVPFSSALSMFWPGSKPVQFAVVNLWASSSDTIQF
jgi:Flp pilus assembly protein TadG